MVVGIGELGKAIVKICEESGKYTVIKKDIQDIKDPGNIDIMHLCIPYSENFADIANEYIMKYKPKLVIINSTVTPGTTNELFKRVNIPMAHVPVRAKHPDLTIGLRKFIAFIGAVGKETANDIKKHYNNLGVKTEILKSPVEAEVGKLLSTTYYAVNIAFHQEMKRICDECGADFDQAVTRFNETCTMDKDYKYPRPVLYPGYMGGHCLIPNIKLLKKRIKSDFLDAVLRSNKRKASEENIKEDPCNQSDIDI